MNHVQQPGQGRVQVQSPAHRATWAVKLWEHVEPLGDLPVSCGNGQALMEGAVVLLRPFQQLSWAFWASVSLGENSGSSAGAWSVCPSPCPGVPVLQGGFREQLQPRPGSSTISFLSSFL